MYRFSSIVSFALLSATLSLACSSSKNDVPAGAARGAVNSAQMTTVSAVARVVNGMFEGAPTRGLRIVLSDKANTCDVTHSANAAMLDLRVRGDSVGPGTYPIVDSRKMAPDRSQAEVDFNAVDPSCKDVVAQAGTGGTVTLDTVTIDLTDPSASRITGSVDFDFDGGHVAGTFEAKFCDGDAPAPAPQGQPACAP
jgi:hypothetical protein